MATGLIEHLEKKLILRRFETGYGGTISAGAAKRLLPSDAGYTIPEGYYPVGVTRFTTGHSNLVLDFLELQNNSDQTSTYLLAVKNVHASNSVPSTAKAIFDVLFAPEWMVEVIDSNEPEKQNGDIMREPVFKIKNFTGTYSVAKDTGEKSLTRSDLGFFVPEGYEIFSLRNVGSGAYRVSISDCDPFSPNRILTIRNTHTAAVNSTADIGVVFINRKFMLPDTRKGLIIRYNTPTLPSGASDINIRLEDYEQNTIINPASGEQIFPQGYIRANRELRFRCYFYNTSAGYYEQRIPSKVEIISGSEYINFVDSTTWRFIIPEDWTDRQIILNFTFD